MMRKIIVFSLLKLNKLFLVESFFLLCVSDAFFSFFFFSPVSQLPLFDILIESMRMMIFSMLMTHATLHFTMEKLEREKTNHVEERKIIERHFSFLILLFEEKRMSNMLQLISTST